MSIRGNWDQRRVERVSRMGEIDRRKFVALTGANAAALIFGYGPSTEKVWARPSFSGYPFRLGVASGDPEPDGVVLWTRLAPEPLADNGFGGMPKDRGVEVRWEVATDENFRRRVRGGRTIARPRLGHSVHVEVGGCCRAARTSTGSWRATRRAPSAGPRRPRPRGRARPR